MKTLSKRTEEMIKKAYPNMTKQENEHIKKLVLQLSINAVEQVRSKLLPPPIRKGKE